MASRVHYAQQVQRFILDEATYLGARSKAAAFRFRTELKAAESHILDYPEIGPLGRTPGTRRLVIGPYVLVYRINGTDIEIIAMRHGRQAEPDIESGRSPSDEEN
jgi:plasmid stabilization system protein ParE